MILSPFLIKAAAQARCITLLDADATIIPDNLEG
jgi:hypothetical protein